MPRRSLSSVRLTGWRFSQRSFYAFPPEIELQSASCRAGRKLAGARAFLPDRNFAEFYVELS